MRNPTRITLILSCVYSHGKKTTVIVDESLDSFLRAILTRYCEL